MISHLIIAPPLRIRPFSNSKGWTRFLGLLTAVGATAGGAQTPSAGVPIGLAEERVARVHELRYEVTVQIPAAKRDAIYGQEVVRFQLTDAARPIAMDFAADSSSIISVSAPYTFTNGHIIIPAKSLTIGENDVTIRFRAGNASLNRNDEYLYTLFVPARASLALPVFDQPDLKARWKLTLTLPDGWQAVANGAEVKREGNVVEFAETKPLPTYLFGFVAGKWLIETATRTVNGRDMVMHMYHRETDTTKVTRNRDSIFDLAARSLAFMERYTGIQYPFGKYDFVAVPSFQFGGMEHAGAVLYQASTLFLDESATQNQKLGRASLIAHETAHMWFGDLVTMRWFNDVWLKEVMANFMAAKIVEPSFPEINHRLRFTLTHYPAAYDVDRTAGTHPIRQDLGNLIEAAQLYGAIIYEKAPIVMMQLEELVGADAFREGMREYLSGHAYGNAVFGDMIAALQKHTTQDLRTWSRVWVEEAGRPSVVAGAVAGAGAGTNSGAKRGSRPRVVLMQSDPLGRGRVWVQPLNVALIYADSVAHVPVRMKSRVAIIPGAGKPLAIIPNGDGRAYGNFILDRASRDWLLSNLPTIKDAILRGAAWLDLWDAMLDGQVAPPAMLDLELSALRLETDEQITARILDYARETYWRYLTAAQRTRIAPQLEAQLWERLAAAPTASRKAAYFATLRSVALTPATIARLKPIWAQTDSVAGLKLSDDDYTALASALALRNIAGADSVLDAQFARIRNPDRKARFAFVRPALSKDEKVRDAWFDDLRRRENRAHEPWVLEGLSYLNHPLRGDAAIRYIEPALQLLEEVRATGDIFFPKRWLDASLSGHSSPQAALTIKQFLTNRPNYPIRLRQIVLQAGDPVFRAAKMETRN